MSDKHDIEAAALADDSIDVGRIALVLKARDEQIGLYKRALSIACCDRSPERGLVDPIELFKEYLATAKKTLK